MAHKLTDLLAAMDMTLDAETCPGLVRADQETLDAKRRNKEPLEEIVALERAIHFDADYVYFRRFIERPPVAVAYLYDWTERLVESRKTRSRGPKHLPEALAEDLAELHRGVWSACEVPLVYVFLATQVQVYHVLQGPKVSTNGLEHSPWQVIELAGALSNALERLKAFSARRLDDGRFWEEYPEARALKLEGAAFMALSEEIAECRSLLVDKHGVDDDLVRRLLILFVMIKYLEERKDRHKQGVFPEGKFAEFAADAANFVDLLRAGGDNVLAFLDHLAQKDRFNGDVFQLDPEQRQKLRDTDLRPFADLLDGRIEKGQRTFWRRYAFHELPVELISHLYEQFLPRQPGVVYTPPFLVSFILDEVLPLSGTTPESFRLIDPACGSGVFLVGAFKRLVQRWRRENDYQAPDATTLKGLLRSHIFGVDSEGEAIRLTMFSLSVALCDFLEPRVIWDELHFDCLQEDNLIKDDFFAHVRRSEWNDSVQFDLVVGNPPFVSELTPAGKDEVEDLKRKESDFELPDQQAALLFLKTATRIAKPSGQIALVQPSGPLLYGDNSGRFRKNFFKKTQVVQVVDLTHLSRVLFKRQRRRGPKARSGSSNPGDVAVAVLFAENRTPEDTPLLHVTVRRTVQAEQKLMFEIDHYDLHFISSHEAVGNPFVWKSNFIGGGRISHLVRRLGKIHSLGSFLDKAERERGWVKGEGYIAGSPKKVTRLKELLVKRRSGELSVEESAELRALEKRYREATWLTGHTVLPTDAFTSEGIDWDKETEIQEDFFAEPRQEALFSSPLLLIKEVIEAETGKLPVELLSRRGVRFKDRILGIHAPPSDLADLERIRKVVSNDRLVRFHILATSPEYLINKSSAFRTADVLSLPFPKSPKDLAFSQLEEVLVDDALEYVAEFKRKGEGSSVWQPPNPEQLEQFGDFFCRVLGSVYPSLRPADPVVVRGGICYPFYFGKAPSEQFVKGNEAGTKLDQLLTATVGASLRCQRILRIFYGNMLLLVKPAQLRYWLRSIAIRDADEIFVELQGRGH